MNICRYVTYNSYFNSPIDNGLYIPSIQMVKGADGQYDKAHYGLWDPDFLASNTINYNNFCLDKNDVNYLDIFGAEGVKCYILKSLTYPFTDSYNTAPIYGYEISQGFPSYSVHYAGVIPSGGVLRVPDTTFKTYCTGQFFGIILVNPNGALNVVNLSLNMGVRDAGIVAAKTNRGVKYIRTYPGQSKLSISTPMGKAFYHHTLLGDNTNLLTANQSGVETDLTGFYAYNLATLSRDTTYHYEGSACLKVACSGNTSGDAEGFSVGRVAAYYGDKVVGQLYLRGTPGKEVNVRLWDSSNGQVTDNHFVTLTGEWQPVSTYYMHYHFNYTNELRILVHGRYNGVLEGPFDIYADKMVIKADNQAILPFQDDDGKTYQIRPYKESSTITFPILRKSSYNESTSVSWDYFYIGYSSPENQVYQYCYYENYGSGTYTTYALMFHAANNFYVKEISLTSWSDKNVLLSGWTFKVMAYDGDLGVWFDTGVTFKYPKNEWDNVSYKVTFPVPRKIFRLCTIPNAWYGSVGGWTSSLVVNYCMMEQTVTKYI